MNQPIVLPVRVVRSGPYLMDASKAILAKGVSHEPEDIESLEQVAVMLNGATVAPAVNVTELTNLLMEALPFIEHHVNAPEGDPDVAADARNLLDRVRNALVAPRAIAAAAKLPSTP
jgi:hypothetical protein